MSRICTICARGGSKGIKNKNIAEMAGKPFIAYTIEQAQASGLFDWIAVSSDSSEILEVAHQYGVPLLIVRPAHLATDTAAKLPAIRHCVEEAENRVKERFDVVVDLDATAPLRLVKDIQGAVHLLESQNISTVITGTPACKSPYFNLVELDENHVARLAKPLEKSIVRRQDAPQCFDMNASIYVWQRAALFDYPTVFHDDTQYTSCRKNVRSILTVN